jgi:hypothetical protein
MADQNVCHSLLQVVLSKPYLSRDDLTALLQPFGLDLTEFVQDSNALLLPLGMEIRQVVSDYTLLEYYGVCNIYEDLAASECLGLKAEVVQVFYKFIDCILSLEEKGNWTIPTGVLFDKMAGMPASQVQEAIGQLADLGYLDVHRERLRIGPRGLLEFRPTLTSMGGNENAYLQQCPICLDFVLAGLKCARCECYCHRRCAQSLQSKCPICRCQEPFVEFGL